MYGPSYILEVLYPKAWLYGSPTTSVELHDLSTSRKEMIEHIHITLLVQSAVAERQWFLTKSQIIRTPDFIYKGLLPTLFAGVLDHEISQLLWT
jgi:hypothetical protein